MGYNGGDEHRHHAGDLYVDVGQWFNKCEPNVDDHLHTDCDECGRLDYCHGKSDDDIGRWSISDHNRLLPGGNARHGVCGLHNRGKRRDSALYLFSQHEYKLSSIA